MCALGDLLLDVVVRLERPFARGDDAPAQTLTGPGGQAANVAAWAAALGARARFLGKRGDDPAGALAAAGLAARGVELHGPVAPGRTGVVVSVVEPDGERTMASDRGVSPTLAPDEVGRAFLDGADWLFLSGYSLMRPPLADAALRAAALAADAGTPVAVDLSSWSLIRASGRETVAARVARAAPAVVFAGERELEELGGCDAPTLVRKRGARGFDVGGVTYEPPRGDVVDTTGAGDALAAGFLVGGAEGARAAAARCVAQVGSLP